MVFYNCEVESHCFTIFFNKYKSENYVVHLYSLPPNQYLVEPQFRALTAGRDVSTSFLHIYRL